MRRIVTSFGSDRLPRRIAAAIAVGLGLACAVVAATTLPFRGTAVAQLVGVEVPTGLLPAVNSAGLSCPALNPARLAGQIMAESGFSVDATTSRGGKGVAGLTDAEWDMWKPSAAADRSDPNANIVALSHDMCNLAGTLRAAQISMDLWLGALGAFHSSVASVVAAQGIPPETQTYVDAVAHYAAWYQSTPQFGGPSTQTSPTRDTTPTPSPTPAAPSALPGASSQAAAVELPQAPVVTPSESGGATTRQPCVDRPPGVPANTLYVLDVALLCSQNSPVSRYEIGVDTSGQLRSWLESQPSALRMNYPGGQAWGAVFVTVGPAVPPGSRPGQDLSRCRTLLVDLSSPTPGAVLSLGMKDSGDADDGSEAKVRIRPGASWVTYSIPLSRFVGLDTASVYVVTEFVFETGDPQQTVDFRNIRLLC